MSELITTLEGIEHPFDEVRLDALVLSLAQHHTAAGERYLRLELGDARGEITAIAWSQMLPTLPRLSLHQAVRVEGELRSFHEDLQIHIRRLIPLRPEDGIHATALLPKRFCPTAAHPALQELIAFHRSITIDPLRVFLNRVFLDPAIGIPLLSCRASVQHHHHELGGLLVHSVRMLPVVGDLFDTCCPRQPRRRTITQIGFLLHDVAKIRTVGEGRRPQEGQRLRHDYLTAEMLGEHLKWLHARDAESATLLREIFDYCAKPRHHDRRRAFIGARIVHEADCLDAAGAELREEGGSVPRVA